MKKDKNFDCVKMEWDIQKQIHKEFERIREAKPARTVEAPVYEYCRAVRSPHFRDRT